MRSRTGRVVTYGALAAAGLACGGATEPLPPCAGPVSLTVTGGRTPTIAWTPECGARSLLIIEVVTDSPAIAPSLWRWWLVAEDRLIEPPLRYGRTPSGVMETEPVEPLESGRTYMVSISTTPNPLQVPLSSMTFTP